MIQSCSSYRVFTFSSSLINANKLLTVAFKKYIPIDLFTDYIISPFLLSDDVCRVDASVIIGILSSSDGHGAKWENHIVRKCVS